MKLNRNTARPFEEGLSNAEIGRYWRAAWAAAVAATLQDRADAEADFLEYMEQLDRAYWQQHGDAL